MYIFAQVKDVKNNIFLQNKGQLIYFYSIQGMELVYGEYNFFQGNGLKFLILGTTNRRGKDV